MLRSEESAWGSWRACRALLLLAALALAAPWAAQGIEQHPPFRSLLSGSSSGTQPAKWLTRGSGAAQASHPRQRIDAFQRSADFYQLDPSHSRRLMQNAPTPAPASATGVEGQPSNTTVYTIVNNNANEFGPFVCIDACAHGNTCIWQNAWLWQCNGTNPTHHYWVWEPDTKIIRSATTDSFEQNPEICLNMCTDTRYGNGACVVTANSSVLNVGYAECTGSSNQQWELQGTQIVNTYNNQCLSAGAQSCGRWSDCNKSQAQTRGDNQILNVFVQACDPTNPAQAWTLGPAPNSTLINFTPLNVSAAKYPSPNNNLALEVTQNSPKVINFENAAGDNSCLSIENQASCQSSEVNGSNIILNEGSTICVWQNAMLQTCWTSGTTASADQQWVYDNTTKLIALATNPSENVCLEMCTDNSFANSACSLTADNVGWASCTGAPEQQWTLTDGLLYNEYMDMCINEQPLCMVDYTVFLNEPSAVSEVVDGFTLGNCLSDVNNGPWAAMPYNRTAGTLGFRNLIGGPCDQLGNGTLRFSATPASNFAPTTDPIAPGITASAPAPGSAAASSSSSTGAIVGGVVGGVVGAAAIILALLLVQRSRAAKRRRLEEEDDLKKAAYADRGRKLDSVDSDVLAPARSNGLWIDKLQLGDEIKAEDIQIAKQPDGSDWKLGEGAFGTVYKAHRFGVQPVAAKVLREESGKQIENFKREIDLLRGLRDNNIVLFLGVCKKDGQLMLVTEYMPQGDLWHALNQSHHSKFMWYQRGKKIALDVARGLVHLHSRDIVHMDLKSPNILLGKDLTAKIADVGLARSVSNSYLTQMTSIGTMAWAAPELKRNFKIGKQEGPRSVTAKADVFSFGVVLWEIVTAEDPSVSSREVRVPDECPAEVEAVIQDCLEESGDDRPDMKTVFERLRAAANVPAPDGAPTPSATSAMSSPQWSRDGSSVPRSGPKSNRSAPKTGDYVQRLGLAAAMKMRLGVHYSGGPPKSSTGLHTQSIREDAPEEADLEVRDRDDSAEEHEEEKPLETPPEGVPTGAPVEDGPKPNGS